jgi:hypothetical protein
LISSCQVGTFRLQNDKIYINLTVSAPGLIAEF